MLQQLDLLTATGLPKLGIAPNSMVLDRQRQDRDLSGNFPIGEPAQEACDDLLFGRTGYSSKTAGDPYMLMSIAAVVIGGTSIIGGRGKIIGTIGGALVMTILINLLTVENIDESVRMMIQGGLILALLIAYAVTED